MNLKKNPKSINEKKEVNLKKTELKQPSRLKKVIIGSGLGLLSFIIILCLLAGGALLFYQNKIYPHVQVGNIALGGLSRAEAKVKLKNNFSTFKTQEIIVKDGTGKSWTLKGQDAGFSPDESQTATLAYQFARNGNLFNNLQNLGTLFISPKYILLDNSYNEDKINSFISTISQVIDQPGQDASLEITPNGIIDKPSSDGQIIDQTNLRSQLIDRLNNVSRDTINLKFKVTKPKVYAEGLEKAQQQTQTYLDRKITLKYSNKTFIIDRNENSNLLTFSPGDEKVVNGSGVYLKVDINKDKVNDLVSSYAKVINTQAKDATLGATDGNIVVVTQAVEGREVDGNALTDLIIKSISEGQPDSLTIPVNVIKPKIADDFGNLGIKELIGTATTSFAGSPSNRVHNIAVGANALNSQLIKPGDEFSTLKLLGNIDAAHGYLPELVIKDAKVLPEDGGGLCQVSTTLFRAVLNAGLNVTERQNHSLRVSYYEPPVGLDATIYSNHPDFKFKNNTNNWILVQSRLVGNEITFNLYGSKDGRRSEIIGPTILSTTPAPATEYVDDSSLPAGKLVKIEGAFPGAKTVATYNVYDKDGKVIDHQVFTSVYKAVGAQYRRGTGN
jgi:vancomycin resistance protein YoaR